MPALPSSLISSLSAAPATCGEQIPPSGLLVALGQLPDPRARRGVRHRLATVVAAAVCAVLAGYRSYTAIGEWVADLPAQAAARLGIQPDRRPSEAMIRRLLQTLDPARPARPPTAAARSPSTTPTRRLNPPRVC
jgi:DDE_Tnp_1-associated